MPSEAKTEAANKIQAFLVKTVPYYKRKIMIAQDMLPKQPIQPKEDADTIKVKWNYQIRVQEIEFHGKNLLTRLRHVEVNEGIVDTEMEEGENTEDQETAAQH